MRRIFVVLNIFRNIVFQDQVLHEWIHEKECPVGEPTFYSRFCETACSNPCLWNFGRQRYCPLAIVYSQIMRNPSLGGWEWHDSSLLVGMDGGSVLDKWGRDEGKRVEAALLPRTASPVVMSPDAPGQVDDYNLSLLPSTSTILCMYIFFMFSRAGFRY